MSRGRLTREWRQTSGNVPKCGFLRFSPWWRSGYKKWTIMKMCLLGRRTYCRSIFDKRGRRLLFFSEKTSFLKFSQKKNERVDISSDWWVSKILYTSPRPEERVAQSTLRIFFCLCGLTRYKIQSAEHILKNLLLRSFEIRRKIYTIQIS